ncbi:MAG: hypothetical protein ABI609_00525 [Acidobacteriota bacterium]
MTVLMSDTHFGVGKNAAGNWLATEDFRWSTELAAFLNAINVRGGGHTDLVLNGDTFELWQSLGGDCSAGRRADESCTEEEALARLSRVAAQHATELKALGEFAKAGDNRLYIVPGNHDAALLFPRVSSAALAAIAAPAGRACIESRGFWLSGDGKVLAEHGHQIGRDVNGYGNAWPMPFSGDNRQYLVKTWGEQFVQSYYNRWEEAYPIIDNLDEEGAGVRYGLAAEGGFGAALATAEFVRFMLFGESWGQFGAALGPDGHVQWDTNAVRNKGDSFLRSALEAGGGVDSTIDTGLIALKMADLSDADLTELCDRLYLLQKERTAAGIPGPEGVVQCSGHLGALYQTVFRTRDRVFKTYLEGRAQQLRDAGLSRAGETFQVYVYSHTHRAEDGFQPLSGAWSPRVFNTGAWQRLVKRSDVEARRLADKLPKAEVLTKYTLDDLPACYSFVTVSRPGFSINTRLERWVWDKGQSTGKIQPRCAN